MISRLLYSLERSVGYLKNHPQLIFVLMLILVIPFLFLYSGQQFLDAGRANQERLQKDRIGLLQDSFVSILYATDFSTSTMQQEIERITALNPDIMGFNISALKLGELAVLASLDQTEISQAEIYNDFYKSAAVRTDESLIYETKTPQGRQWLTYRAIEPTPGTFYFLYTQSSLEKIDALFAARERSALFSLIYVYAFLLALAYWHIRLTDYRYLYLEAKKASEIRDLFTNLIVHELRAPLSAIRGYASMVVEADVSNEVRGFAEQVKDSAERLLLIVNDLLDVARLHSGQLAINMESINVSDIVKAVVDELQISAIEKQLGLTALATDVVHEVSSDPKRLHQALTNLVSNAIKYTPDGTIELSIEDKYNQVEIRVKDTGKGISFEDQKKLFAPFFRVNNDDVSKITGSGLGMWITKQLIELMGGSIAVESIKGVGTHLVVQLPKA